MKTKLEKIADGILQHLWLRTSYEEVVIDAIGDAGIDPDDLDDEDVEALFVALERALNPRSRAEGLWRFTRNGSRKSERTCYVCGRSVTWCTKWPRTRQSIDAEAHDCGRHIERVLVAARARYARKQALAEVQ